LIHDDVYALYEDSRGNLWVGTGGGLGLLNRRTGRFSVYRHNRKNPNTLSHNIVLTLLEDRVDGRRSLWIGTNGGGLNRMILPDRPGQPVQFIKYAHHASDPESLSSNIVMALHRDGRGALWIGTSQALDELPAREFLSDSPAFIHHRFDPSNPRSLSDNYVTDILRDKSGTLWFGTARGLNRMIRQKEARSGDKNTRFIRYTESQGLANDMIYGLLEDADGDIWISSNSGLSRLAADRKTFTNYDMSDGLQSKEFNGGVCFKSPRTGEMFFGGINGFNAFYPREIEDNPHKPAVVITDFRILGHADPPSRGRQVGTIPATAAGEGVILSHRDKTLLFEFAALHYSVPEKNRYAYKLEGFDTDWTHTRDRRQVTYTNLDPGDYVFRVKGSNHDGVWNEEGISLPITIIPPFWQTWWFRTLMVILFALISYFIIHFSRNYLTLTAFWKKQKYVGQYRIQDKIATGGMGTVYRAHSIMEKTKPVALKVLREELSTDETNRRRFKNEAAIIDQLDHRNIVKIFERGEHKQRLFLAMELLQGETLAQKIAREEKIDLLECIHISLQILDALRRIHHKKIVHRDLKPENIMLVEEDGDRNFVKLLDFGLARRDSVTRLTESGMIVGTITYISPEQIARQPITQASDLYAFGIVLYEMVTGEKPFLGDSVIDIMRQILDKKPLDPLRFRSEIPQKLNDLILSLMAKKPERRPGIDQIIRMVHEIHLDLSGLS
jgi:tRNA A-37 threonylcarbamoyl transferase component Bud32